MRQRQRFPVGLSCRMVLAVFAWMAFSLTGGEALTDSEEARLSELNKKEFPSTSAPEEKAECVKLRQSHGRLRQERDGKRKTRNEAETDVKLIENEMAHVLARIQRMEERRKAYAKEIVSIRDGMLQFNEAINQFSSGQIDEKSYLRLGGSVYRRGHLLEMPVESAKVLVVDCSHPVWVDCEDVGGDLLGVGTGAVQFVILRRNGESYEVIPAGEKIEITERDMTNEEKKEFRKEVLFYRDRQRLRAGDLFGVFMDSSIQLTYDDLGTGSAVAMAMTGEMVPEQLTLPAVEDGYTPVPTDEQDAWKRHC